MLGRSVQAGEFSTVIEKKAVGCRWRVYEASKGATAIGEMMEDRVPLLVPGKTDSEAVKQKGIFPTQICQSPRPQSRCSAAWHDPE